MVANTKEITLKEATELVQQIPNKEGKKVEWDEDNNLTVYKELLLTTFDNKEAAQPILGQLKTIDVITKLL